ncbi:unnamed protein product [Linum trigynum]|uniref:TIR domain-containing protein n=1 Tax=Linum trigynum TaxID=586398 RepID=A0AAV2GTP5_9ROSI
MSYLEGASTAADPSGRRGSDASIGVDSDTWQLPLPSGEYEVFLNFRGPDTRYQITDILYRFLVRLRIRTFLDDEDLREGEGIWPSLVEAIEQSKIYVPIFSEDYANSKWCLRELAAIVERQKHEEGCIILPIFYMVNPSDVRHQTGPFKKAFRKRARSFDEKSTVQEWRDALSKVGALKGWHVESNDKQGAIADLVSSILLSRDKGPSQVQALRVNSGSFVAKEMASDCFVNLSELRYLDAEYTMLIGDFSNLLPKMRWFRLHYHRNAGHNKLTNLKMENLTILDLHSSDVPYDWGGWSNIIKVAEKLKVLDLAKCYNMTRLPCFPTSGSLEILNLSCLMVRSADLDLGNLSNLKVLLLKGGGVRKITGGTIRVLKQLRELDITEFRCENLGESLADIGELQALKHLRASGTDIVATHGTRAGIRLPTSLKELITSSPIANLSELIEMETLVVRDCSYGLEIPPADTMWWKLSKLKSMELYGTRMTMTTISLRPFGLLPSSLTRLDIREYWGLDWLPNLENLENLTLLSIHDCPALKDIQGLGGLKSLEILIIDRVSLSNLLGLDCLVALKTLEISSCHALRRLPSLASLSNLSRFHSFECPRLVEIQGIEGLESLQVLSIVSEDSLSLLEGLGTLMSFNKLQILQIWGCPLLTSLSSHVQQHLGDGGGGASRLVLNSLRKLSIGGAALLLQTSFGQMLHLSKFPRLLELEIEQTEDDDVDKELLLEGLDSLEELTRLTLRGLATQKLPSLSKLQKLEALTVTGASNLREIEGIADLKSLEWLVLRSCTSFETLPEGLSGLKRLRQVNIEGSTNLTGLFALSYLPPNVYVWAPNLL